MKNVTLTLLAAAAIGAISIGSVSAMPVNNLAGLGESHLQDVRLVCDRFGRCYNTRRAYRSQRYYARPGYYGQPGYYGHTGYGYYGGPRVGAPERGLTAARATSASARRHDFSRDGR